MKKIILGFFITLILISNPQQSLHASNMKAIAGFGAAASSIGSALLARHFFKKSRSAGRMLELRRSQGEDTKSMMLAPSMEALLLQQQRYRTLALATALWSGVVLVGGVWYGVKNLEGKVVEERKETDEEIVNRRVKKLAGKYVQNPEDSDDEYGSDEDDTNNDNQQGNRTTLEKNAEKFANVFEDETNKEELAEIKRNYKEEVTQLTEAPEPRLDYDSEDGEEGSDGEGGAIEKMEKTKIKEEFGVEIGDGTQRNLGNGRRLNKRSEKKYDRPPLGKVFDPPEE